MMRIKITGVQANMKRIRSIAKGVRGDGQLRPVYRAAAIAASRIFTHIFDERGKRYGEKWEQPTPWSKVLRAKGNRRKFRSLEEAANTDMQPLIDTATGKKSFLPGHPDNILRASGRGAVVGSNKRYMAEHNKGGAAKFQFGKQEQYRLRKNFAIKINGKWNQEYFRLRAQMKKRAGTKFALKQRQIEPEGEKDITRKELDAIHRAMDQTLDKVLRKYR